VTGIETGLTIDYEAGIFKRSFFKTTAKRAGSF
jgi:hypothetical protein